MFVIVATVVSEVASAWPPSRYASRTLDVPGARLRSRGTLRPAAPAGPAGSCGSRWDPGSLRARGAGRARRALRAGRSRLPLRAGQTLRALRALWPADGTLRAGRARAPELPSRRSPATVAPCAPVAPCRPLGPCGPRTVRPCGP